MHMLILRQCQMRDKQKKRLISPFDDSFQDLSLKFKPTWTLKHRDRIAFMRVVSGAFERGMDVTCNVLIKSKITRSTSFMADDKETGIML